ncbi:hypothetical protein [Polyangium aurulentum]|uniref:hypothetical protein n=1 Tax=Polyangium aurulentum TaxID=2567896 RepID=UPI0010AEA8FB|nr:hypothetical protein [Polyangium aurulentum]UQA63022.1 hypothetical protein E8A73_022205 [Polyangium aurulentum]
MAERNRDALAELEALARATDDLSPTDELTEAVIGRIDPAAEALARAARGTEDLAPSAGFTTAVMRAVGGEAREPSWSEGVNRWARVALLGAAAAAALSLWVSNHAESVFDTAILEGVAAVEVDE